MPTAVHSTAIRAHSVHERVRRGAPGLSDHPHDGAGRSDRGVRRRGGRAGRGPEEVPCGVREAHGTGGGAAPVRPDAVRAEGGHRAARDARGGGRGGRAGFRVARVEQLVRIGPDGPEGPRPSAFDPEPPVELHSKQLREQGLLDDDEDAAPSNSTTTWRR
ncbi:DUF5954 family protein [Streptomyces niveus]|uniref:DUF5954 family protein n=2 Tax=Streptomyces niveus TaxID=193462 RepID=UPI00316AC53D